MNKQSNLPRVRNKYVTAILLFKEGMMIFLTDLG